ncbi:hypothetical protein F8388_022768 [Cannabis sativa]|uniref:RNase H type-1 domain-containing protein n=1 Tax=Cannabis sativa TaxID=3483 RepID=A0A7J6FB29_CANSA|nr:hypothetical protein F8388_022768 [Cannabis sativa]
MDELLSKTHNLQVSDEDEWEVDKNLSITVAKSNLRGRLCTSIDHSRGFLKRVLGGIWRLREAEWNLKIVDKFNSGLFLTFTFSSESIQNKILTKMPWYLSNGLLILGKMENSNDSWKNDLTCFPIWGRALGVPVDFLTPKNTVRLAAMAGEVITVHNSDISKMVANAAAYGIWLKVENATRDRFQDGKSDQGNHSSKDKQAHQETLGLEKRIPISNSFASLDVTTTHVDNMLQELASKTDLIQKITTEGHGLKASLSKDCPGGKGELEKEKRLDDESGRGKRRLTDDHGLSWQGKQQKTITQADLEAQMNSLHNVPITYAQDIPFMEGPSSFVVGMGEKILSKEHRRKVSVKKDSKAKKGKNGEGNWDMEEVGKHFHRADFPWIQGIPIDLYTEDLLTWPYTSNGNYMVKSGYRVGREMNLHPTRCSNMGEINNWWKKFWKLQLPPRMKMFGWRVCNNWLPAKTNLCHRGMNINPVCDLCGYHVETLPHALWSCDKVKQVWKLTPWYKKCGKLGEGSMFDILTSLREKLSRNEFEDALKIMWAIWENRNRKWNKLHVMNGIQLLDWVFTTYPPASSNPMEEETKKVASPSNPMHWQAPHVGKICVNCDAAMIPNQIGVGVGFIWRDWNGNVLNVGMIYIHSSCSINVAEAWEIHEALKKHPRSETRPVEIQSDCKAVVEALKNQNNKWSDAGTLLLQIEAWLKDHKDSNIIFVNRNYNEFL